MWSGQAARLEAGGGQHPFAELADQADVFRDRNELGRRELMPALVHYRKDSPAPRALPTPPARTPFAHH